MGNSDSREKVLQALAKPKKDLIIHKREDPEVVLATLHPYNYWGRFFMWLGRSDKTKFHQFTDSGHLRHSTVEPLHPGISVYGYLTDFSGRHRVRLRLHLDKNLQIVGEMWCTRVGKRNCNSLDLSETAACIKVAPPKYSKVIIH